MKEIILIGYDAEIIELIETINKIKLIGIVDNNLTISCKYPIIGDDESILCNKKLYLDKYFVLSIDDPIKKKVLYKKYKDCGLTFLSIISENASISSNLIIGEGVVIQRNVNLGPSSKIGNLVKLNINVNIMHDGYIGKFSTVAPNALTLGYVKIEEQVFIGANSTILPKKKINKNIILGAGSVVTKDLNDIGTYVGNPARLIK